MIVLEFVCPSILEVDTALRAAPLQDEIVLPVGVRVEGQGGELQGAERKQSMDSASVHVDQTASTGVSLLLSDGRWITGTLQSIRPDSWSIAVRSAGSASEQDVAVADIVAFVVRRQRLRPAIGSETEFRQPSEGSLLRVAPLSLGVIETVDGQRIPGTFRVVNGVAIWDHRWIGAIPIDLEQVSNLRMIADRSAPQTADSDAVLLVNGDVVRGFVDALDEDLKLSVLQPMTIQETAQSGNAARETADQQAEQTVSGEADKPNQSSTADSKNTTSKNVVPAENSSTRNIAMNRVAAIALAEMPIEPRDGVEIWTSDGSLVAARNLTFNRETGWGFELASDWLSKFRSKPTSDNSAADPIAGVLDRSRWTPLSSCSIEYRRDEPNSYLYDTADLSSVGRRERFLLGCADVVIEGPCTVRFNVPNNGSLEGMLLTGVISITEPAPSDVRVEVSIGFEGGPSETIVLDGVSRTKPFVLRATAGVEPVVVVTLNDGGNGIIGDRVVLERTALVRPR